MKKVQFTLLSMLITVSMIMSSISIAFAEDEHINDSQHTQDRWIDTWEEGWEPEDDFEWDQIEEGGEKRLLAFSDITYDGLNIHWMKCEKADGYRVYSSVVDGRAKHVLQGTIKGNAVTSFKVKNLLPLNLYLITVKPYRINSKDKTVVVQNEIKNGFKETPMCYDGKYYSSNEKVANSLNKVLGKYKYDTKYKIKGGEHGYADWASKQIAKSRKKVKINKNLTQSTCKKYICNLKPGSLVRLSGRGHSLVIIKATNNYIVWADYDNKYALGSYAAYNKVLYYVQTPSYFVHDYSHAHKKIDYIQKTTSYR